jgi:DNA polymerase type B, organellar and viral
MRPHATIDLETDPFLIGQIPEPFAADFFDGKTHFLFWGADAVVRCLRSALTFRGIIYAHNGGKFDFHFLMPFLVEIFGAESLEVMTIGSRIVKIKIVGIDLEFRDSFALIPKPLKAFGGKLEIDINKLKRECRERWRSEICEYLKQDCVGLWQALADFMERYGCEITLASTTFKLLRTEFGFKLPKTSFHHDKKFRPYYFAGRVQFFALGECAGFSTCCDVNSMFPWAMTFPHWFGGESVARLSPPKKHREQSFYDVTCDANGCLPSRGPKGEVLFPVGRNLRFRVTGWELFAGIECGLIQNVRYNAIYCPTDCRDFGDYVRTFYHLKQHAPDESERQFAKLILNSAYGKFALDCRQFKTVRVTGYDEVLPDPWRHSYDDIDAGLSYWNKPSYVSREKTPEELFKAKQMRDRKRNRLLEMPGRKLVESPDDDDNRPMRFNNVCTAASITGCARAKLIRSNHVCGGSLYMDTDSITARDVSRLEIGEGLGQWKIEKEFDGFWIGGKKLYAGRARNWQEIESQIAAAQDDKTRAKLRKELWKTASKGVRLTPEQIVRVALGESQKYEFDAPNFSPFSAPSFTTRTVNRDDKRKRR